MRSQNSRFNVPQKIEILLDPAKSPGTVRINDAPIDNLAGICVQTLDDDVGETLVTLKIRTSSAFFNLMINGVK